MQETSLCMSIKPPEKDIRNNEKRQESMSCNMFIIRILYEIHH